MSKKGNKKKSKEIELNPTERIQLNVRVDRRLTQVLKGLAEYKDQSLGELIEQIVVKSFEPYEGLEGKASISAHDTKALEALEGLKKVYGLS